MARYVHMQTAAVTQLWMPSRNGMHAGKKMDMLARALIAARQCIDLDPTWPKGYLRSTAAEFELVAVCMHGRHAVYACVRACCVYAPCIYMRMPCIYARTHAVSVFHTMHAYTAR